MLTVEYIYFALSIYHNRVILLILYAERNIIAFVRFKIISIIERYLTIIFLTAIFVV